MKKWEVSDKTFVIVTIIFSLLVFVYHHKVQVPEEAERRKKEVIAEEYINENINNEWESRALNFKSIDKDGNFNVIVNFYERLCLYNYASWNSIPEKFKAQYILYFDKESNFLKEENRQETWVGEWRKL